MNATVSHEMRNPLNSIIAHNIKMQELVKMLRNFLEGANRISFKMLKKEVQTFIITVEESLNVQLSSSKLLDFCVNDMISLA